MRAHHLILAGTLLAATPALISPALAFDNGNVEQPSRITTQSGQTTAGPAYTSPYAGGSADVVYGPPRVVEEGPVMVGPGGVVVEPAPGVVVVPVR